MSLIVKRDTNGVKPLLQTGEFGYDNYPAGGDSGRVYVGTGSVNIPLAKQVEMLAVDGKADAHIARVDNPHEVTKAQVGLGNVENLAPADMPISSAGQAALNTKANKTDADLLGVPKAPTAAVGTSTKQIATTEYVRNEVGIVESVVAGANLARADKYLASQNIANMVYTDGDLTKIQYKNATDVDYEVFSYSSGDLSGIAHYVGGILKGNSVLLYTDGDLSSVVFTEV